MIGAGALLTITAPAGAWTTRNAVDIDAGYAHTCAVTTCGEVKCWGRNDWGQAVDKSPTNGPSLFPQAPFTQVSVGQYHTCALDEDQSILCWGKSNYGQTVEPVGNFVAVDSGYSHSCALDTSGNAVCWGANSSGQSSPPAGQYMDISAGRTHTCAVTSNGQHVRCWGSNAYGQGRSIHSTDLTTGELFAKVSAGDYHTCALTQTNRVYCWGYDYYDEVSGDGTAFDQGGGIFRHAASAWRDVSAGAFGTVGLFQDGPTTDFNEVWAWGWPFSSAHYTQPIFPPSAPVSVAAGYNHACIIDHAGDVTCFGNDQYGKSTPDAMSGFCSSFFPLYPLEQLEPIELSSF